MWADQATPEETEKAIREVTVFCRAFPQFRGDYLPNREALIGWLRSRNMSVTARNLVTAFQALAAEGRIVVNPSAIGIGTDEELSGARLAHHPQLWKLLEPAPTAEDQEKLAERKMSAAEYKAAHIEDWRQPPSERMMAAWAKASTFFIQANRSYVPTDENKNRLLSFIEANGLQINPQGLQAAFNALKGELELNENNVQTEQVVKYTNLGGSEPGYPALEQHTNGQDEREALSDAISTLTILKR